MGNQKIISDSWIRSIIEKGPKYRFPVQKDFKLLTSFLTTIKNHVIKYCEKGYERSGKNLFGQ